jgi:iron-sulfur cluster assembly protein
MITLTPPAKQHIQKMLINRGENAAFRLSVKKTGCSGYMYVPEIVTEKIQTDCVLFDSNPTIYIDTVSLPLLEGTVIDYVQKNLGLSQLVFNNPNAESLCGCGESFNLKTV